MPRSQFLLRIYVQNKASTHSDCTHTALKQQEVDWCREQQCCRAKWLKIFCLTRMRKSKLDHLRSDPPVRSTCLGQSRGGRNKLWVQLEQLAQGCDSSLFFSRSEIVKWNHKVLNGVSHWWWWFMSSSETPAELRKAWHLINWATCLIKAAISCCVRCRLNCLLPNTSSALPLMLHPALSCFIPLFSDASLLSSQSESRRWQLTLQSAALPLPTLPTPHLPAPRSATDTWGKAKPSKPNCPWLLPQVGGSCWV